MDTSHPRISANELGNFVFSTDAEKRRILHRQKFPKAVVVSRYQSASKAVLRCLQNGVFCEEALKAEIKKLSTKPVTNRREAEVRRANVIALKRFLTIGDKATPAAGHHSIIRKNALFEFDGITISVRPDILTQNVHGHFFTYSKLRFSSHKYSSDASEIVLLLLQKFAEQQHFEGLKFDAARARLIDCFSQQVFEAHEVSPYKGKLLMKALQQIHGLWPFIPNT